MATVQKYIDKGKEAMNWERQAMAQTQKKFENSEKEEVLYLYMLCFGSKSELSSKFKFLCCS